MKKWVNGEILLIMLKKMTAVLCIFASLFFFSSCKMPERQDWSQLIYMTDRILEDIEIDIGDSFFYDGKWFLIVSAAPGNDILITAVEDENLLITSFSVTALNTGSEGNAEVFQRVASAVVKVFSGEENASVLLDGVGLFSEGRVFSEETFFCENGRYAITFFNAEEGCSLMGELLY